MQTKLEHTKGRVVIKVDIEQKNTYQFGNGQVLILFPNTNQMDRRYHAPVSGIVVSAEDIPIGSQVLVEHNSCHPTNEIVELKDDNPDIKYYSVPELEVYVWRKITRAIDADLLPNNWMDVSDEEIDKLMGLKGEKFAFDWHPTKYYAIAERVYEPYTGVFHGIKPSVIKNTLLIKTGELKGKIVHTVKNGQYEIIYQDTNGQPNEILVTFHVENEDELSDLILNAKQEVTAINHALTERYLNGELLTGLTPDNCKPLQIETYAD